MPLTDEQVIAKTSGEASAPLSDEEVIAKTGATSQAPTVSAPPPSAGDVVAGSVEVPKSPAWQAGMDQKKSLREKMTPAQRAAELAGGAIEGAAMNLAAVPVLGGAGRAVMLGGKSVPYMRDFGGALSAISKSMESAGPKALAAGGAAIGALQSSLERGVQDAFDVSKEAASNIVASAMVTPVAAKALFDKLPSFATTNAKRVVSELFGPEGKFISQPEWEKTRDKLLAMFGESKTVKQDSDVLAKSLEQTAATRKAEIEAAAKTEAGRLERQQTKYGQIPATTIPRIVEGSRKAKLGPDQTPSQRGDFVRKEVTPQTLSQESALSAQGRQGWSDMSVESNQMENSGNFISNTPPAQAGVKMINDLIEVDPTTGTSKVDPKNPLYQTLKNWRDRMLGRQVEMDASGNVVASVDTKLAKPSGPTDAQIMAARKRGLISTIKEKYGVTDKEIQTGISEGRLDKMLEGLTQGGGGYEHWAGKTTDDLNTAIREEFDHLFDVSKAGATLDPSRMHYSSSEMDNAFARTKAEFLAAQGGMSGQAGRVGPTTKENRQTMYEYDLLRRELNDIANAPNIRPGDAQKATLAREISNFVSAAESRHMPKSFDAAKADYHHQATATEDFRTKLAAAMQEGPSAAHTLDAKIFSGRDSVRATKRLMGGDQGKLDQLGLSYVSDSLRGKNATSAEKWLDDYYRDWAGELSPAAQQKIASYLSDLKRADQISAAAKTRAGTKAGQLRDLPSATKQAVEKSTTELTGTLEAVPRFKQLLTTPQRNREEMRAVYQAVKAQPGGEEAFKKVVRSVLREQPPEKMLETFDNLISDKLIDAGSHTPAEMAEIRKIIVDLDSLVKNMKVGTPEVMKAKINEIVSSENKRGAALYVALSTLGGAATMGSYVHGGSWLTGGLGGLEAAGLYAGRGAYQRNANAIKVLADEIIANPEMYDAAIAPATPSSVTRFKALLGQAMRQSAAISTAESAIQPVTQPAKDQLQQLNASGYVDRLLNQPTGLMGPR